MALNPSHWNSKLSILASDFEGHKFCTFRYNKAVEANTTLKKYFGTTSTKQKNVSVRIKIRDNMDMLIGQQLLRKNGEVVEADDALKDKKIICYYFSAHWCPPCR